MDRRKFIKQSSIACAGMVLSPLLLSSCKKEFLFDQSNFSGNVIVVGAGVSGLYAAYLLNKQGVDVQILEAAPRYGGRIKSFNGFADFDIELGAEITHGEYSPWFDLVRHSGGEWITESLFDLYHFNGSFKTIEMATEHSFFKRILDAKAQFKHYSGEDISAEAFGNISGIHASVKHIYNGLVGNELGTSNSELGMYGLRERERKWSAGKNNFRVRNKSLTSILDMAFSDILNKIQLNTTVVSVDYSESKVILGTVGGTTYEADRVILTVPVSILKQERIEFYPPLADHRIHALNCIGMDRALKIVLKFNERFWPESVENMYLPGLVPRFSTPLSGGKGSGNVLTAYVCGENADTLIAMGSEMIPVVLSSLDDAFGDASSQFLDSYIQDWKEDEFIRGGISYTKPNAGNAREVLSGNLEGKVFFAGEATHTGGHSGTVHGAMETALHSVAQILKIT